MLPTRRVAKATKPERVELVADAIGRDPEHAKDLVDRQVGGSRVALLLPVVGLHVEAQGQRLRLSMPSLIACLGHRRIPPRYRPPGAVADAAASRCWSRSVRLWKSPTGGLRLTRSSGRKGLTAGLKLRVNPWGRGPHSSGAAVRLGSDGVGTPVLSPSRSSMMPTICQLVGTPAMNSWTLSPTPRSGTLLSRTRPLTTTAPVSRGQPAALQRWRRGRRTLLRDRL